ncbi:uncharacterized protein LOC126891437 [Diabrotica virgifera virgifera]|uniref:ATP-dependent DNA helicase n=1 Tax=Diabrotica virgifera virgifera TaxID=50390 RepID=A0ABM5L2B2_DIAVI|nr:uncharacterized protein LOC126891437 [Diabrotica virgifera virgifera]
MPAQLRRLFAYLLCYCSTENALELWRTFKRHFIEDYVRRGESEEIAEVKALRRVDNILRYLGTSLSVYGIPIPETNEPTNDDDSDNDGGIVDRMNVEQRLCYEQLTGGDIKQLLPIVGGGRVEQLQSLLYHCNAWHSFKHMKLSVNMRADAAELEFANWLENVGRHSPEIRVTHPRSMRNYLVQIPNECVVRHVMGAIYGYIDFKFPTLPQLFADRSIICLRIDVCTEINNKMLRRLPSDTVAVCSVDNVDSDNPEDAENFPMEFLNRIKYGGLPIHELMLKVGAPVILLHNIDARSVFASKFHI